jgi:hypothetical protein
MITIEPKVLAAGISIVAVIAISAPARGADCGTSTGGSNVSKGGPNIPGCNRAKAARRATSSALTRLPATFSEDLTLLYPSLAIDLDETELTKRLDAPSPQVTWPPPLLMAPKPAEEAAMLGSWSKSETERNGEDTRTRSGAGVNYKPSTSATIGMTVESEENNVDASLTEQTKLAATFGLKPSPLLTFEATAAWAHQNAGNLVSLGTQSAQNELSARIKGDWQLGAFKLAPNLTVAHATEVGAPDIPSATKGTVVVAPTISRPVTLDHAQALEPFLTFKQEMDLNAPALHVGSAIKTETTTRSVGGGVKLEDRGTYSLSVGTNIENLEAERQSLRSEFRVNVPLK